MTSPRLVIFDVDGTISDSQSNIVAAMTAGFAAVDLPAPDRAAVLGIVGLSLDHAVPLLAPDQTPDTCAAIVAAYKDCYNNSRTINGSEGSPLYPGIRSSIETLAAQDATLLGIATGKSMRGLAALLESHALGQHFVTVQTADHHPSKPHPAMLLTALSETGVGGDRAVMIGDTSFDLDMAKAAGMSFIAVDWGYHSVDRLTGADLILSDAAQLPGAVDALLGA